MNDDFDIKEFLTENDVAFTDKGSDLIIHRCPFCGRDKKLYINSETGQFYCFVCKEGAGRSFAGFASEVLGISIGDAINLVEKDTRPKISQDFYVEGNLSFGEKPKAKKFEPIKHVPVQTPAMSIKIESQHDISRAGYDYCLSRGITDDLIDKYDIMYSCKVRRIVFPVYMFGRMVGWQARDVTGTQTPKALSCPGFRKSEMLYNYDAVVESEEITIVEGPVDAIKCSQINGVALFGKVISDYQFNLVRCLSKLKRVNVALDAGESGAIRDLARRFSSYYDISIISFPDGTDAGDHSPVEVLKFYKEREPYDSLRLY